MQLNAIVYSAVQLFAECVATCLAQRSDVVASPCAVLEGVPKLLDDGKVNLVLLDVSDSRVLNTVRSIGTDYPAVRTVALALPEVLDQVIACADAGFTSYVPRTASLEELCGIAVRALREEVLCDPKVSSGLMRELRRRGSTSTAAIDASAILTQREREVLQLMSRGMSNKEIARTLVLSVATVKNHVHNILSKIRVHSRSDALTSLGFELPFSTIDGAFARRLQVAASPGTLRDT